MAALFAVGLPFTYDGTTNHFATTTGGAASVAAVTSADTVTVDSLSGNATMTIGATFSCSTLTINNVSATVACDATHGITATGALTVTTGTLNTNNQAINVGSLIASSASTKVLTTGTSALTFSTANGNVLNVNATGTTADFSGNVITTTGTGAKITSTSPYTFSSVNSNNTGSLEFTTAETITGNLTIGTATGGGALLLGGNITVSGVFTVNGNNASSFLTTGTVSPTVIGTQHTIALGTTGSFVTNSAGACFTDTAVTGTVAPISSANPMSDGGGNSGITFTTPTTLYKITAGATWEQKTAWSLSTGGVAANLVPLLQDTVNIDSNSGTTVSFSGGWGLLGKDIIINAPQLATFVITQGGITRAIYGSLTWTAGAMTNSGTTGLLSFRGRGTHTLSTNGQTVGSPLSFDGPGGSYTLSDNLTCTLTMAQTWGTLDTNSKTVSSTVMISNGTNTRALTLGTTNWSLTTTGTVTNWNMVATGLTLSAASATIIISTASANTRTFSGGGLVHGTVTYTVAGSTGSLSMSAITIGTLNFSDASNARTLSLSGAVTIGTLNMNGTPGALMSLISSLGGTKRIITPGSTATWSLDYLSVTDIRLNAPYHFFAGTHSTDGGNNNNVMFQAPASLRCLQTATGTSTGTSQTATFPYATTAGNVLVAFYYTNGSDGGLTPPSGWTQAITKVLGAEVFIYWKVASGSETTVTFSEVTSRTLGLLIEEWSGFTSPVLDVTDTNSTASSVSALSTTATTGPTNTATPALAVAVVANALALGATVSITNSFLQDFTNAITNYIPVVKELTATGTNDTTITWTTARASDVAALAVIKSVTSSGTSSRMMMMGM